ncbi:Uncharacterised protein [Mycobacteroides abscessus]|nr:Uncharacterised protein [Mycobacteroides abscessus]
MLGVGDDRVRPEAGEVLGLGRSRAARGERRPAHRRGPAGAALVEQHHPVRRESGADPAVRPRGPGPLAARAALEEHEQRQVVVTPDRVDELAHEQREAARVRVVVPHERHLELAVDDVDAGQGVRGLAGDAHPAPLAAPRAAAAADGGGRHSSTVSFSPPS